MMIQDTWTKAHQIRNLAKFGGFLAFDDVGQPITLGEFVAYFEVIERLANEVCDEIEKLEHEYQTGIYAPDKAGDPNKGLDDSNKVGILSD